MGKKLNENDERLWRFVFKIWRIYLKYLYLADIFKKFRNNGLKNYRSCPSHSLSAQGLSWDATFKMTKIELEFIPDPDM